MIKIFTKEDITPLGADRVVFALAPVLAVAGVLGLWAVIPFAANAFGVDLNVGVLYLVAVGTLSTLAIMLAGWSANNKYALLGAFRTVAQMISYEVPLVLSLLVPVLLSGSLGLNGIVGAQREVWFVFSAPLAALLFLIASQAEVSRAPFDLLEAESEIVAGFNIEYSGMKFGFFFVGEFLHSFTMGLLGATLFLGGWTGPGVEAFPALGAVYLILKGTFVSERMELDNLWSQRFKGSLLESSIEVLGRLGNANINVRATLAVAAGGHRYGGLLWVAPADVEAAARSLGAVSGATHRA